MPSASLVLLHAMADEAMRYLYVVSRIGEGISSSLAGLLVAVVLMVTLGTGIGTGRSDEAKLKYLVPSWSDANEGSVDKPGLLPTNKLRLALKDAAP